MSPVRDAVTLVDHEHGDALGDPRQDLASKCWLANRSGAMSRMSTSSRSNVASTADHSSTLSEVILAARTPIRVAARIWFRIRDSKGDTNRAGPAPASRRSLTAMK